MKWWQFANTSAQPCLCCGEIFPFITQGHVALAVPECELAYFPDWPRVPATEDCTPFPGHACGRAAAA